MMINKVDCSHVRVSESLPAFLSSAFVRPNSHLTLDEWRWLRAAADDPPSHDPSSSFDQTRVAQFEFVRSLLAAVDQLNATIEDESASCRLHTSFVLEYKQVTMLLVSPHASNDDADELDDCSFILTLRMLSSLPKTPTRALIVD